LAGLPQIAGPWTDHVSTLVDRLSEGGGLVRVENEEELACRVKWFLENPDGREKAGMMAQEVFRSEQGALSRTLASVRRFLLDPRPEAS
jgi:3-deoxy-D-manno-octulosonic-acid transferase